MVLYGYYMGENPEHIIAVDGGGSGCRVILADTEGQTLARANAGPANLGTDFNTARDNILDAVFKTYHSAGLTPDSRSGDVAWLGLAGAGFTDLANRLEQQLGFKHTKVSSDSITTVEGALGGGDGTVVLIGTGSFIESRHSGNNRHIGGWGYQLGDECGGAWLGRKLLQTVLYVHDGLLPPSDLTRAVFERFSRTPNRIVRFAQKATPGEMAGFAPEIAKGYEKGDPVAREIMSASVRLLCERLDAVDALSAPPLYLVGGLAGVYLPLLPERYKQLYQPAKGDALAGALSLARKRFVSDRKEAAL